MRIYSLIATAILSAVILPVSAASSSELEALLSAGRADEAFLLGAAGPKAQNDKLFDYFLGMAAIESGRKEQGIALLKEYLAAHSTDLRARLELARGYFLAGEFTSAREEFLLVRKAPIPSQVAANIDSYVSAIDARQSGASGTQPVSIWNGYLEAGMGYDSNVNGGIAGANVNLPIVGTATIDSSGVRQSASFARVAAGANGQHSVSGDWAFFAAGNIDARRHNRAENFDNLYANAQTGLAWQPVSGHTLRVSLGYNSLELNKAAYRTSPNGQAEWQWSVAENLVVTAGLQDGRLFYRDTNEARDARFDTLTGGLRVGLAGSWRPVLAANANYGRERTLRARDDFSRDSGGVRLGVEATPTDGLTLTAGYGEQSSRFVGDDPFFALARRDYATSLDFSATYSISSTLSLRGDLSHAETHSNIALYQNRRGVASVSLRYAF